MAKLGKLTKLKSAISIKKWPSFSKPSLPNFTTSTSSTTIAAVDEDTAITTTTTTISDNYLNDKLRLRPVYVGKSKRKYLLSTDIVQHPLFQELVDKDYCAGYGSDDGVVVSCEVVLFEHLLWMLDNADGLSGSMDELVEFYTC